MLFNDERLNSNYILRNVTTGTVFKLNGQWYLKVYDTDRDEARLVNLYSGYVIDIKDDEARIDCPDNVELRVW